jgi:hypothetical protein
VSLPPRGGVTTCQSQPSYGRAGLGKVKPGAGPATVTIFASIAVKAATANATVTGGHSRQAIAIRIISALRKIIGVQVDCYRRWSCFEGGWFCHHGDLLVDRSGRPASVLTPTVSTHF